MEPGIGRISKSTLHFKHDFASLKSAFYRTAELSSESHLVVTAFEYYSLNKVHRIPNDATAFNRLPRAANTFTMVSWKHDDPENQKKARQIATEIVGIIASGQAEHTGKTTVGYNNYGAS